MAFSVVWLKDLEQNRNIDDIVKKIEEKCSKEDVGQKWTTLAIGKALEDMQVQTNNQELDLQSNIQSEGHLLSHPIEVLVNIFRKHCSKTPPFCRSIYGITDQLLSLQLVMAQIKKKKTGQFEADVQTVVTNHQHIMKAKLTGGAHCSEIQDVNNSYNKFLDHCNAMDYADVICNVRECFQSDSTINDAYLRKHYIILGWPVSVIEIEVLSLLIGQRQILQISRTMGDDSTLTLEEIINQCQSLSQQFSIRTPKTTKKRRHRPDTPDNHTAMSPQQSQTQEMSQSPLSQCRIMMGQALSVFMSYLQLLVNTRDELALARVINVPSRDLGTRQFNKIKQVARDKNMTMFQMVMSFILKIRLGGKSYAPSSDNPLHLMTKGLGEFVSFFQKLQNVIEEDENPKAAVLKIINTLQSTLKKSNTEALSWEDIQKASNFLKKNTDIVEKDLYTDMPIKENKSCMLGLNTYVLLYKILDKNVLYDYQEEELYSVLKTPRRIQGKTSSLLTKFRTPEAPSAPKNVDAKTQHEENYLKFQGIGKSVNETVRKRTSIWEDVEESYKQPLGVIYTPTSRKRPHEEPHHSGAPTDTCSPQKKRPYESAQDQENINLPVSREIKRSCAAKRGLIEPLKKTEVKKRNVNKNAVIKKKKKLIKIVNGQQLLTCFLR